MEHKNGCYDRKPFFTERQVQDGWNYHNIHGAVTKVPKLRIIPANNSMDCQHNSANDPACEGCKWQKEL